MVCPKIQTILVTGFTGSTVSLDRVSKQCRSPVIRKLQSIYVSSPNKFIIIHIIYIYKLNQLCFVFGRTRLGLGIFTCTRKSEPEPIQKYPTQNRTENLQVPFESKFLLPKRTGTERNRPEKNQPEQTRPGKNRFVPDLKTCVSKTMIFLCSIIYIIF